MEHGYWNFALREVLRVISDKEVACYVKTKLQSYAIYEVTDVINNEVI